jgi:toxin ParE1/3/4
LVRAILDVADDAERAGSQKREEIAADARTYHLWHSRDRVATAAGRVRHPRHLLLYRTRDDGRIEIARVLHDSMDLAQHLPEEYRAGTAGEDDPESS